MGPSENYIPIFICVISFYNSYNLDAVHDFREKFCITVRR
jgi:hypothetical protein